MILIVGCGITGVSVAHFLTARNINFCIADTRKRPPKERELPPCQHYFGSLNDLDFEVIETIVLSPGLDPHHPFVSGLWQHNIPIISDIDLFYRYYPHKTFIGITGTNGKSTTTKLLEHILQDNTKKAIACGNIGVPICATDAENIDIFVIELSSYQLDITHNIKLDYSIVLNITPDHLDRYHNFDAYRASKLKIHSLSIHQVEMRKYNDISFQTSLLGEHNLHNIWAAATIAEKMGLTLAEIQCSVQTFNGLPHRLEFVSTINGIDFYNDSKATNAASTITAISALLTRYKNITLIIGGEAKNEDYNELFTFINQHINTVILIGASTQAFAKKIKISEYTAKSMQNAVNIAKNLKTEVVALSPACASFDMYNNFNERGEDFKQCLQTPN